MAQTHAIVYVAEFSAFQLFQLFRRSPIQTLACMCPAALLRAQSTVKFKHCEMTLHTCKGSVYARASLAED